MKDNDMVSQDSISIGGIVIAAAWSPNGDVTAVDIASYDEKRYRVVGDRIGKKLREHVKVSVVVDGMVRERKGGLAITVKRFRFDNPGTPKSLFPNVAAPLL